MDYLPTKRRWLAYYVRECIDVFLKENEKGVELDFVCKNNMRDPKSFADKMEKLEIRYFGAAGDFIEQNFGNQNMQDFNKVVLNKPTHLATDKVKNFEIERNHFTYQVSISKERGSHNRKAVTESVL